MLDCNCYDTKYPDARSDGAYHDGFAAGYAEAEKVIRKLALDHANRLSAGISKAKGRTIAQACQFGSEAIFELIGIMSSHHHSRVPR
jgi:hypothetical protein